MSAPTKEEIRTITRKAVVIFALSNLPCCLFGGAGCMSYGCSRTPNDVDLIIMTNSHTTEYLKNHLVSNGGGDFYTRPSKKIGATYKLLFYRLPSSSLFLSNRLRSCKVDILIPGIMNIPMLPTSTIVRNDGLPVLPFFALLMLKVQGWSDHRNSDRSDYRSKQYQDVDDINKLLVIGKERGEQLKTAQIWLPAEFATHGARLIAEYVRWKGGRASWEALGVVFADG